MTTVAADELREVGSLVRDVLAHVPELVRARATDRDVLQECVARVFEVGAVDAAASDDGGLGLEGAAVVATEAARIWSSLGWALMPSLLLRAVGDPDPVQRTGLAARTLGGVPDIDLSGRLAGLLGPVVDGAGADAILVIGSRVLLLPRSAVVSVMRTDEYEGLRDVTHDILDVDGTGRMLDTAPEDAEAASWIIAGAVALGIGEAAVMSARDYQRQRVQFGRPIAEFGEMRAMLADGAARIIAARQAVFGAAGVGVVGPRARAGAAGAFLAASGAAVRATEMAQHSHGGYGHMKEFPVHALVRDARMVAACGGSHIRLDEAVLGGIDQI